MIVAEVFREFQSVAVVVLDDVGHAFRLDFFVASPVSGVFSRHVLNEEIAAELHHGNTSFGVHNELETWQR